MNEHIKNYLYTGIQKKINQPWKYKVEFLIYLSLHLSVIVPFMRCIMSGLYYNMTTYRYIQYLDQAILVSSDRSFWAKKYLLIHLRG